LSPTPYPTGKSEPTPHLKAVFYLLVINLAVILIAYFGSAIQFIGYIFPFLRRFVPAVLILPFPKSRLERYHGLVGRLLGVHVVWTKWRESVEPQGVFGGFVCTPVYCVNQF
jgi:hypothetical protein